MSTKTTDDLFHFCHYFHPAGHGTFFTGHIRKSQIPGTEDDFTWVYDCGSKRPSHLRGLIEGPQANFTKPIDIVCISHFDSDHVCGLELLLKTARARVLVLPYISLEARLRLASQVKEKQTAAHQVAAFAIDPSKYLMERGLGDRFDRIVLVRGQVGRDRATGADEQFNDLDVFEGNDYLAQIPISPLQGSYGYQASERINMAAHGNPWKLGGVYEIVFYNTALVDEVTTISKISLNMVAKEIEAIVEKYELCSSDIPKAGWLLEIKKCYLKHFGTSSKRKNDISLCALGSPLIQGKISECKLFPRDTICKKLDVRTCENVAILLTGDISLDQQELAALKQHVGSTRWEQVRVMQIPHHGSQHSWEPGLSALCTQEYSVVCAPPKSAYHPHKAVMDDLKNRKLVIASYKTAVCFDYHIGS